MAKVLNPLGSSAASGRFGPQVWSYSRFGSVVRQWYPPVNPRSVYQTARRREFFAPINFLWSNLTRDQVVSWNEYARDAYPNSLSLSHSRPSAQNVFFKINFNRLLCGQEVTPFSPIVSVPDFLPTIEITWTASGASLSWTPSIPAGGGIVVRQRRNLLNSNFFRKLGAISNVFLSTDSSPQLVTPGCGTASLNGPGVPFNCGSWIHFWLHSIDPLGRASSPLFFPLFTG